MSKFKINHASFLTLIFTLTYMASYITRINYSAVISEMVTATSFQKSELSLALTGSFVTYGVGQIISGMLGDRFSPKKLISVGLVTSVIMNLLIPFCKTPLAFLTVWSINGFAQSFMWPPLVKLMTLSFTYEEYENASVKVSFGSSMGTIAVYLISPILISLFSWRAIFVFAAVCGIIMLFIWNIFLKEPETPPNMTTVKTAQKSGLGFINPLFIGIMVAIVLQGMLRDGVSTWMPSYISETYNLSNASSILTGVILPVFSIICIQAASKLYIRKFKNPLQCAAFFFVLSSLATVILYLSSGKSTVASVLCSAMLTGCMHGVNLILICMIPPFYRKNGNISTVSGILNSCTYIGSSISSYGIAVISEKAGWSITLGVWLLIALAGVLVCTLCIRPWRKTKPSIV